MTDIDPNTLMIAAISAGSALVGGFISSGTNFLIEWQRSRNEEKKHQQEEKANDLSLHYQAYIKFLSLKPEASSYDPATQEPMLGNVGLESALVLAHGSPFVASELANSYPFKSWKDVRAIQDRIVDELAADKLSRRPLSPPKISKGWWQFWK